MTSSDNSPIPHYPDLLRLDGKGFVVVGAGQGMGRQTSHALVQCGARVVCVDIDADRAADIAEEVGGTPWSGDATARADVERLLEDSVAALGQVYGLVDIIGMAEWGFIVDMDDGVWDRQMAINLRHAYLLGQVFGRHMVANGEGSMVFIASASGMDGAPEPRRLRGGQGRAHGLGEVDGGGDGPPRGSGQCGGPGGHRHSLGSWTC